MRRTRIADDIVFAARFAGRDSKDRLYPTFDTPRPIKQQWSLTDLASTLDAVYKYGVKMHQSFYDEWQGYYTALQESGFDDKVREGYWK